MPLNSDAICVNKGSTINPTLFTTGSKNRARNGFRQSNPSLPPRLCDYSRGIRMAIAEAIVRDKTLLERAVPALYGDRSMRIAGS